MRFVVFLAAWLAATAAHAQTQEWQARSYVMSAFITGAAPAILNEQVIVGDRLRATLSLARDADRERIYEALFTLTEEKEFKVRSATASEAGHFTASDSQPVLALQTGDVTLLMQYDLAENNVVRVGLPAPAAAGASAAQEPRLIAVASAPAPLPQAPVVLRLKPVQFDFDKAALTSELRAQLENEGLPKLADIASARFTVAGHADRLGPAEYNQQLSMRRAEAVRAYLVAKGVAAGSIRVMAFGATQPVAECLDQRDRTALIACLAPNRRVTVEIEPSAL